ncbi:Arginase, catabolizes arginine to ornithine and urea [Bonamia ostreae]|uniref:Arginase, catabolizes arginine to ornithine and urea n=1 Tax=Bonamia ostreae TaxID=126728 RepID=A0ABV2AFP8_9EUKA
MSFKRKTFNLISAPFYSSKPTAIQSSVPKLIRESGAIKSVVKNGFKVRHIEEILMDWSSENSFDNHKVLSDRIQSVVSADSFTLILGGDENVSLGTIPGILRKKANSSVIKICPESFLGKTDKFENSILPLLKKKVPLTNQPEQLNWLAKVPPLKYCAYIGLSETSDKEKKLLKKAQISYFHCPNEYAIHASVIKLFEFLRSSENWHLSLDFNVLKADLAVVRNPQKSGLSLLGVQFLCKVLYMSGNLTSMEMLNVDLGHEPDDARKRALRFAGALVDAATGGPV